MNIPSPFLIALLSICSVSAAAADDEHSGHDMAAHDMTRHAAHTGAAAHIHHRHGEGDWMVEYRLMRMSMSGLRDGTDSVDDRDISGVLPGMPPVPDPTKPYRMAPTDMTMDMHMLMVMYGLTDRLSLMTMASYRDNEMDMVMHMPMMDMFGTTKTDGLGDSLVGVMIQIDSNWTTSLSAGLPTGDIDQRVDVQMTGANPTTGTKVTIDNRNVKAGYPMQLGSGTYDVIPAVTYAKAWDDSGIGFQASYIWRIGDNDNGYRLGDVAEAFAWGKYVVNAGLLISGKLSYMNWGRIDGQDPDLDPSVSPVNDPAATGGKRMDASIGVNAFFGEGHSLGIELGIPVYQDLNGPQMEMDWILSFVYQYMK